MRSAWVKRGVHGPHGPHPLGSATERGLKFYGKFLESRPFQLDCDGFISFCSLETKVDKSSESDSFSLFRISCKDMMISTVTFCICTSYLFQTERHMMKNQLAIATCMHAKIIPNIVSIIINQHHVFCVSDSPWRDGTNTLISKCNSSKLPNVDVLSHIRQTRCSVSASIHCNTLKVREHTSTSILLRGYACYYCCMPSSPVLLHICLVWELRMLHALIPCVAVYIMPLFLYFLVLSSLHHSTF